MMKRTLLSYFFGISCMLVILSCTPKEEYPIRLITFKGEEIFPYSKFTGIIYDHEKDHFSTFPTQNGDILVCKNFMIRVGEDLADTLVLKDNDSLFYINKQLSGIAINHKQPSSGFFEQLSDEDIRQLRTIQLDTLLTAPRKSYLKRIAQVNPNIDLVVGYDSVIYEDLFWLSQHFNPRVLSIVTYGDSLTSSCLVKMPHLETLILGTPSSVEIPKLPKLKSLRNLFIFCDSIPLPSTFFSENLQLERLTVFDNSDKVPINATWHELKNLRELNIIADSLVPYSVAQHHPKLQTLTLAIDGNLSAITDLKNLKWLTIVKDLSKHDLDFLTVEVPNLELLCIINTDTLGNYSALSKLSKLKYLIIANDPGLDTTLYQLKGLTYLSMAEDFMDDSLRFNALQRALPNTIISPNSGMCMGSGWLLLLIPLTGLWFFLYQHFGKKNLVKNVA
jgi:hypothetical protein